MKKSKEIHQILCQKVQEICKMAENWVSLSSPWILPKMAPSRKGRKFSSDCLSHSLLLDLGKIPDIQFE